MKEHYKKNSFCIICHHLIDTFTQIFKPEIQKLKSYEEFKNEEIYEKPKIIQGKDIDEKIYDEQFIHEKIIEKRKEIISDNIIEKNNQNAELLIKEKEIPNREITLETKSNKLNYKPLDKILYLEELGSGGFGKVYKAFDYNLNNLVALKIIKNQYYEDNIVTIFKEVELLNRLNTLNHKAFIKFYNIFSLPSLNLMISDIGLSMEYGLATLKEALEMKKYKISEIVFILNTLVDGLAKAEEIKVANRDIKPENLILVKNNQNSFMYKFIDFGIGCILDGNQGNKIEFDTLTGFSKLYAAPEIINYLKLEDKSKLKCSYNPFQADVYSLGITILKMMDYCDSEIKSIKKQGKLMLNSKKSEKEKLLNIVSQMLEVNPEKRLTFKEILDLLNKLPRDVPNENDLIDKINIDKRWIFLGDITKEYSESIFYKALDKKKSEFVLIESINIKTQDDIEEMILKNNIIKEFQNLQHFAFAEVLSMIDNQDSVSRTFQIRREFGDTMLLLEYNKNNNNQIKKGFDELEGKIVFNLLDALAQAEEANLVLNYIVLENIIIKEISKFKYKVKFLDTSKGFRWIKGELASKDQINYHKKLYLNRVN